MIEKFQIPKTEPTSIDDAVTLNLMIKINKLIDGQSFLQNQREKDKAKRDNYIEKLEVKISVMNKEIQYLKKRLGIIK